MSTNVESPTLSKIFPFSTVVIVGILVMFKYDRVEEMIQVIADYFDIPRDATVIVIVATVIASVFLAYGIWYGVYYVITLRKAREAAGLMYEKERDALIALFNSLDGKQWKDKTRWCSNEPIERWKGVKIDHNTGRVNKLLLADNQLGGCIPEDIGVLESLKEIDFRLNKIKGTIPKAMSTLKKLEGLYLFDNYIEGKIPHELSLLPELSGIYLYNNNFDSGEAPAAVEVFNKNVKEGCIVYI
mmetsp:Transcript_124438/g.244074  ORF Transcript_124438/g.244074 Transcript_124438/m.244074 type:complete len:243 (+) Transcript_124438:76-804(+)